MERDRRKSVYVYDRRPMAAALLVHQPGGLLQEQRDLQVGALRRARPAGLRHLAGQR